MLMWVIVWAGTERIAFRALPIQQWLNKALVLKTLSQLLSGSERGSAEISREPVFKSGSSVYLKRATYVSQAKDFWEESIGAEISPKKAVFVLTHTHSMRLWLRIKLIKLDWVSHTNLFPVKVGLKSVLCNTATFWPWFVWKNPSKTDPPCFRTTWVDKKFRATITSQIIHMKWRDPAKSNNVIR